MRSYVLVSGLFFMLFTCIQIVRFIMQWPVVVAGVNIPLWASLIAALVVGTLAVWAFRVSDRKSVAPSV